MLRPRHRVTDCSGQSETRLTTSKDHEQKGTTFPPDLPVRLLDSVAYILSKAEHCTACFIISLVKHSYSLAELSGSGMNAVREGLA